MSWEEYTPMTDMHASERVGVALTNRVLWIWIGPNVLDRMGWPCTQRVRMVWGDGNHFGLLRLVPTHDDDSGYLLTKRTEQRMGCSGCIQARNMPRYINRDQKQRVTRCEYRIEDGLAPQTLEITMPDWATGGARLVREVTA